MPPVLRTRTGCWTCRSRKVKCDEAHPICRRCDRTNSSCGYGVQLIWHEESLSKGLCHGRAGVWSTKSRSRDSKTERPQWLKPHNAALLSKSRVGYRSDGRPWAGKSGDRPIFLNTTMRDLELYFRFERSSMEESGNSRKQCSTPFIDINNQMKKRELGLSILQPAWNSPSAFQTLDYDPALISYYEAVICSSSTLLDNPHHNPYRHIILPMAMASEGVYHATLAVSAQKLCLTEPKYRVAALEHGQRAMQRLIQLLGLGINTNTEIDELLGLSLMLCCYEITDGCRPSWVTHLNGISAIRDRCRGLSGIQSSHSTSLQQFFNRYFAFHFVLARTIFGVDDLPSYTMASSASEHPITDISVKPYQPFSSDSGLSQANDLEQGNICQPGALCQSSNFLSVNMSLEELDEIDPYMGFSNSLLLLINEIAELARQESSTDTTTEFLHRKAVRLKKSLEGLHQIPPGNPESSVKANNSQEMDPNTECVTIAEVNRLGALLFLHETCSDQFSNVEPQRTNNTRLSDEDKGLYTRKILDMIVENLEAMIRTAALPLWPLFLAGCCADSEEDRITVMRIFQESEQLKKFGNIKPAREVVEMVWRQNDLGVQDDRKRRRTAAAIGLDDSGADAYSPTSIISDDTSHYSERFVWGRAMKMLGGWKLSLT